MSEHLRAEPPQRPRRPLPEDDLPPMPILRQRSGGVPPWVWVLVAVLAASPFLCGMAAGLAFALFAVQAPVQVPANMVSPPSATASPK